MNENQQFETLDPENWDEMRALAHRIIDDALDYIQTTGERPVWQAVPEEVTPRLRQPAPAAPSGPSEFYDVFLETIQTFSLHTAHPRFWALYMGSGTVMGAL